MSCATLVPMDSSGLAQTSGSIYSGESFELLCEVESLAIKLIKFDFADSQAIWEFQLELLELQRTIQRAIAAEKAGLKLKKDIRTLEGLKLIRWHARRLGDALAWSVLGLDRSIIYPLGENSPVSISQDNHGSRGLVSVSTYLANQGWGFPLLHDLTDCLRIGDATFVRFEGNRRKVRTVESKTRYLGAAPGGSDGSHRYDVSISFIQADPSENEPVLEISVGVDSPEPLELESPLRRPDRRVGRQMARMHKASVIQSAAPNELYELDGKKQLSARANSGADSKWPELRAAIRVARESGYGAVVVDGAFIYACFYDPNGVDPESMDKESMLSDVMNSGILIGDSQVKDSITLLSIPIEPRRDAQQYLPFYLYDIPDAAISDILHGRLVVIVLANAAAVGAAIGCDDIEVEIPEGEAALYSMAFYSKLDGPNGVQYRVKIGGIYTHLMECIFEFRGIDYLRDIIGGMRSAAEATLPELVKVRDAAEHDL